MLPDYNQFFLLQVASQSFRMRKKDNLKIPIFPFRLYFILVFKTSMHEYQTAINNYELLAILYLGIVVDINR